MKVACDRAALSEALSVVGSVVNARSPRPVLQCIKLEATPEELVLSGTDLEAGIHYHIKQVEVTTPGVVLVRADRIGPIMRESVDDVMELEVEGDICHVRGRDSHYRLNSLSAEDFPEVGTLDGAPSFQIRAADLHGVIRRTIYAAARESTRYAINGVLWERVGKKLLLVATDGRRLAQASTLIETSETTELAVIVPIKAMQLAERMLTDPDEMIAVQVTENRLVLASSRAVIASMLVEGHFPKYEDVIPKDCTRRVEFPTQELHSAVRRAALLTDDESKGVRMSLEAGKMVLASRAPEHGEATITMDVAYDEEAIVMGFNPHFFIDALKVVDEAEVTLNLSEPNRPAVLRVGTDFLYVIMPVSLS